METNTHNEIIKAQFSKQATGYTAVQAHSQALATLTEMTGVCQTDQVLDVACGSGIVSCAFARQAGRVTGIDITEEMLEEARKLQAQNNLHNLEWCLGDVNALPFESHQYSIVVTRFSFHHFLSYEKVFAEMIRVCRPGGIVMVVDVALPEHKRIAYDTMELLRDPSHTGVLTPRTFEILFGNPLLTGSKTCCYDMTIDLETQVNASSMTGERGEKFRRLILSDVYKNQLGVNVTKTAEGYDLHYPVHIYMARKKAAGDPE